VRNVEQLAEEIEVKRGLICNSVKLRLPSPDAAPADLLPRLLASGVGHDSPLEKMCNNAFLEFLNEWSGLIKREVHAEEFSANDKDGPRDLVGWWHQRLVRLTAIAEQIENPIVKTVGGVLNAVAKGLGGDAGTMELASSVREWREWGMPSQKPRRKRAML
jgi:hypothetical protein